MAVGKIAATVYQIVIGIVTNTYGLRVDVCSPIRASHLTQLFATARMNCRLVSGSGYRRIRPVSGIRQPFCNDQSWPNPERQL